MDKVRILKLENPENGGTELDFNPAMLDDTEDCIATKGLMFEGSEEQMVYVDDDKHEMMFRDLRQTEPVTLSQLASQNIDGGNANSVYSGDWSVLDGGGAVE